MLRTTNVVESKTPKSKKRWIGLAVSFFLPFVCFGAWIEHVAYLQGQQDIQRWSHLVQPTPVPPGEQLYQFAFWFIGGGLIAGLIGALLYYIFTREKGLKAQAEAFNVEE
ncbi:MAG TPA: hypothetical protein V6D17_05345 [Candidatus Obscuribacterales bacterium]